MPMPSLYELELLPLIDHPVENLGTEIKDWLDLSDRAVRGDVARALIALANHGGGYLLFGFAEATGGWSPSSVTVDLDHYSQDSINNIFKAHAEPVFECHTAHLTSSGGELHVVVRVPGGHTVPIRSRRAPAGSRLSDHVYYIRRPGPESAPPNSAREWDELIARCLDNHHERQLEAFRRIISVMRTSPEVMKDLTELAEGSDPLSEWIDQSRGRLPVSEEHQMDVSEYAQGAWSCAYQLSPVDEPPSAQDFLNVIIEAEDRLTGWPVWLVLGNRPDMRPRLVGGVIECSLDNTRDRDFWRADPRGRMFLIRRFQEDTREIQGVEPGTKFDLTLPVWRTGECLLHAHRLATRLGAVSVDLQMRWEGLQGRELSAVASEMRILMPGRVSAQDVVETKISVDVASIPDALPELVRQLTEPLYAVFSFFQPTSELYSTELDRLRKGL